jgi:hypothetical protein
VRRRVPCRLCGRTAASLAQLRFASCSRDVVAGGQSSIGIKRSKIIRRPTSRALAALAAPAIAALVAGLAEPTFAHGFAGKRFFPATLATDDPFVADELSLPTFAKRTTEEDGSSTTETTASVDFSKRVTRDFGVGIEATWLRLEPRDGTRVQGWDNFALSAKVQFYKSEPHETIVSVGVDADLGGTGAKRVGAESFSTITPMLFAGRGFGDLSEEVRFLRPFAVTGSIGIGVPTRSSSTSLGEDGNAVTEQHPHILKLGFALEHSLPYLRSFVKDVDLPGPLRNAIPIVELALEKPLDRGGGPTVGTVNPGILFPGRKMQFGIEAVIPVNNHTGGGTGVLMQLHFFLDDVFPNTLGRPLVGAAR